MLTDITGDHRHFLRYLLIGALGWLYPEGHPRICSLFTVLQLEAFFL